jgi:hypothetical protein
MTKVRVLETTQFRVVFLGQFGFDILHNGHGRCHANIFWADILIGISMQVIVVSVLPPWSHVITISIAHVDETF